MTAAKLLFPLSAVANPAVSSAAESLNTSGLPTVEAGYSVAMGPVWEGSQVLNLPFLLLPFSDVACFRHSAGSESELSPNLSTLLANYNSQPNHLTSDPAPHLSFLCIFHVYLLLFPVQQLLMHI